MAWSDAAKKAMQSVRSSGGGHYDPNQPRDDHGRWVGEEGFPSTGYFSGKEGGLLLHGTREARGKFNPGHTFMTVDYEEARGFALGAHLGGRGNKPAVMRYSAKPGRTIDVNEKVLDMIMNGNASDEKKIYDWARRKGARYAVFDHPSTTRQKDLKVIVSLFPHKDLKSKGGWSVR